MSKPNVESGPSAMDPRTRKMIRLAKETVAEAQRVTRLFGHGDDANTLAFALGALFTAASELGIQEEGWISGIAHGLATGVANLAGGNHEAVLEVICDAARIALKEVGPAITEANQRGSGHA